MDLQTLSNLFARTLNPDPNERKAAELQIRKIGSEEGMIAALLQIIAADSIDIATRHACSIWLKNRVYTCYTIETPNPRRPELSPIRDSDRNALRRSLLPLLAQSHSRSISAQLSHVLKNVIAFDFPSSKWPTLVYEIKHLLVSGEVRQVHAGCLAALESIRAFRFRQKNDTLPTLVASLFPTLLNVARRLLNIPPSTSQDAPTILHLILKTYKTSIGIHLSKHQQSPESIVPWGQLFFKVVNLRVPNEVVPQDEEERERCEWWKAKKWAYNTLGSLFHRFGNPSQLPSTMREEYGQFAQHFATVFAPGILTIYLQQVELYVQQRTWLSKKCQDHIFQFLTECVKLNSTWAQLKPHFKLLVSNFVFPPLTFNERRQQLWENEPVKNVCTAVDEFESFSAPISSTTSFLFALASNRTEVTVMPIFGFINQVLRSNTSLAQRFGALNMTAALGPWFMRHPEVKDNMEQFMLQFVTPELDSAQPYLRAIALEILGTLTKCGLTWFDKANLGHHFKAVMRTLDDQELPVRRRVFPPLSGLEAQAELTSCLKVKTAVSPQVGKVIQVLLKLSDKTDLEILNQSTEVMVNRFQTELLPVAAQLTARLCKSYLRLARETVNQEETLNAADNVDIEESLPDLDDDKTFTAMGIAKTISTVVASIDTSPAILAQVQEIIIPIIAFTLDHKLLELLDNMYHLVHCLTYKSRSISPQMWPVFESTYELFKSEAIDFLDEMLPSLVNFVSFGSDVIKARADYKQMLLDIYIMAMTNDQLGEIDRINGSKLAESMLLNLRGSLDDSLQDIIAIALNTMKTAQGSALKLANLKVLVNTVLYSPALSLHIMEATGPGMARTFFEKWFAVINAENKLPRVHDKKLTIIALCALLELSPEGIPAGLREGWPGIIGGIVKMFKELPKAIEARKQSGQALQEEAGGDEADDKFYNSADTEGDVWDQDPEMLAREGTRLREQSKKTDGEAEDEDEDEDGDDDSDDEDVDEELEYISPLESVDPYVTFKQALVTFEAQNPQIYQLATMSLNINQQTHLVEIIRQAEQTVTTPQA
ncbi:hypothetical protein D9756_009610 [Leucocoprinus leucothites]|uniref:Importin N-terminal domain-containing protein n=1 Tax=Leucocoprinus leucothites TaxID=201217 RepID=A0A8H5CW02_9AGAR|nr:hypothetical protein D9756_009610 [Leucoagaricus leucothites]